MKKVFVIKPNNINDSSKNLVLAYFDNYTILKGKY